MHALHRSIFVTLLSLFSMMSITFEKTDIWQQLFRNPALAQELFKTKLEERLQMYDTLYEDARLLSHAEIHTHRLLNVLNREFSKNAHGLHYYDDKEIKVCTLCTTKFGRDYLMATLTGKEAHHIFINPLSLKNEPAVANRKSLLHEIGPIKHHHNLMLSVDFCVQAESESSKNAHKGDLLEKLGYKPKTVAMNESKADRYAIKKMDTYDLLCMLQQWRHKHVTARQKGLRSRHHNYLSYEALRTIALDEIRMRGVKPAIGKYIAQLARHR